MEKPVNHKRVQRLMQKMGLRAVIRAKARSNVLQRDFTATAPNQNWATDITELSVGGLKLYLSARLDLYNGEIIAQRRREASDLGTGLWHAPGSAFAVRRNGGTDRSLGPGLATQNTTLSVAARASRRHAKHKPQGLSPVECRLRNTA